jgi:hypothetical protein
MQGVFDELGIVARNIDKFFVGLRPEAPKVRTHIGLPFSGARAVGLAIGS